MWVTDWFTFAAPTKTAGNWFAVAVEHAGVTFCEKHGRYTMETCSNLPSITIRREPATWLRSYFCRVHKKVNIPAIDQFADLRNGPETFEDYALRYIDTMLGAVDEMFDCWQSDYTLRTDSVATDAVEALSSIGVPCDMSIILNEPHSNRGKNLPDIPTALREAINGRPSSAPTQSRGFSQGVMQ